MIQELLPFDYDQAAYFYDSLELDEVLNDQVVKGLSRVLKQNQVKKIWDAACGTGAQSIPLAQKGFHVIGSDINHNMVSIASQKADLDFYQGAMQNFEPGKVDAVIAMMNSLGHISKNEMEDALGNFSKNLDKGGVLIGDVDNRAFLEKVLTDEPFISSVKFIGTEKYIRKTHAHKMSDGVYEINDIWLKGTFKTYEGICEVQTWYKEELEKLLGENGFESIHWYSRNFRPLKLSETSESDSLLFVALKS